LDDKKTPNTRRAFHLRQVRTDALAAWELRLISDAGTEIRGERKKGNTPRVFSRSEQGRVEVKTRKKERERSQNSIEQDTNHPDINRGGGQKGGGTDASRSV